jgi:hypothetical protein
MKRSIGLLHCRSPFYLCLEHVDDLGAYTASRPETGLLIPSGYNNYLDDSQNAGYPESRECSAADLANSRYGFSLKKSTIVFIELGMLAGIAVAGYTLPGSTPLRVFLIAGGACFAVWNIFLARKIKQIKDGETPAEKGPWPHIFRVLAILVICWLLSLLLFKR